MLTISGGQLWNHWFGLKFGYKWSYKTKELKNSNNKAREVYEEL